MRLLFLLLVFVFSFCLKSAKAQETHNCKIYRSIFEYRDNDTLNDYYFTVTDKEIGNTAKFGGIAFDINIPDKKTAKKFRKQYVWGALKDSSFFMNNRRFSRYPGFNLLDYHGYRYFLMMAIATKGEVAGVTYQHSRYEIINAADFEANVKIGVAYDILEDKHYFLNEAGVQEILKDNAVEISEYYKLEDKNDYQSVFRIIEKIDREEYELSKD